MSPITVTCRVGQLRAPATAVPLPLRLSNRQPADFFNLGAAGQLLTMDYSAVSALSTPPETSSFFLHTALGQLTGNSSTSKCVKRIGLLLADRYVDEPTALGYMFDTGFDPSIGDQSFNAVAREGCAIFLDAIRDERPGLADYEAEVGFTAVHELGHVFNLWHVDTPSFMAQSQHAGPFGPGAFDFVAAHRAYLQKSDSPFVCPGGSRWDDRGDLVEPIGNPLNAPQTRRVRMTIGVRQREFWRFEPVQLDVTVAAAGRTARIPDTIDPGYDAFDIWIDNPDGTRRRYRSPVLYCDTRNLRTIRRGMPFKRDIPIFGQSGGYTFRQAGIHRLFCTLRLHGGTVVSSNVVEVYVKPAAPRSAQFRRLAPLMTRREHAQVLFYRNALRPGQLVEPLESAARTLKGTPAAADIRYSVARSLVTSSRARARSVRLQHEATAARLLKAALDSSQLSASRQRRARDVLDQLDRP